MYRFTGFTEKANDALNRAMEKAQELRHDYVGSEHMLLGILEVGENTAAQVLQKFGVTAEKMEAMIRERIGVGPQDTEISPSDFTPPEQAHPANLRRTGLPSGTQLCGYRAPAPGHSGRGRGLWHPLFGRYGRIPPGSSQRPAGGFGSEEAGEEKNRKSAPSSGGKNQETSLERFGGI